MNTAAGDILLAANFQALSEQHSSQKVLSWFLTYTINEELIGCL